jgi:hypothetical protein
MHRHRSPGYLCSFCVQSSLVFEKQYFIYFHKEFMLNFNPKTFVKPYVGKAVED